jgi:Fe-S-cluster-containing dehydrogenase component
VKYGMFIDLDKCVGCQACTIACKAENNVPEGIQRNKVLPIGKGKYPNYKMQLIPMPCMHCEDAPCIKMCPVKATYLREDGVVVQDDKKCVGCKYCMNACPYAVRMFNKKTPYTSDKDYGYTPDYTNPVVKLRPRGVVEKCTFCMHRIDAGNPTPACVEACPADARHFGDIDDPYSNVSKLIAHKRGIKLKEEKLTKPKVYYGLEK